MNPNEEGTEGIKNLIDAGSEIVGSATGAALGFLIAGPEGAAIGGASIPLLTRGLIDIGNDIEERFLSKREKIRIGGVLFYAITKIQEKLASGEMLRDDDFIRRSSTGHPACSEVPMIERPPSEEVIEGLLLAAKKEYEEKKLPFVGNLLANIFFYPDIDIVHANLLIRTSEKISYRQLCLLKIFANTKYFNLRKENYASHPEKITFKEALLLTEIHELWTQEMLNCSKAANLGMTKINPSNMRIQGLGTMLFDLMDLWEIDKEDLDPIVALLSP